VREKLDKAKQVIKDTKEEFKLMHQGPAKYYAAEDAAWFRKMGVDPAIPKRANR